MATKYGAGTHQWNVRLRTFFAMLYVCDPIIVWGDRDQFNIFLVGLHVGNSLRSDRLFHQTLYSSPVPQNLRSEPQSRHVHIRWSPRNPMAPLIILSHSHLFCDFHMHSTRETLESFDTTRTLLWSSGQFQVYRNIQCDYQFRTLNPSHQIGLEVTTAPEEKDWNLHNLCNGFSVSVAPSTQPLERRSINQRLADYQPSSRACIASIVRTYYSWELALSPDVTHNLGLVGLWTYAEISIGIVISCTPIFPRFYQEFGRKIYAVLSFGSMSSDTAQSRRGTFQPDSIGRKDQNNLQLEDPYGSEILSEGNYYSLEGQC